MPARQRSGKASLLSRKLGVSRQRVHALKKTGKLKITGGDIDVSESVRMHQERLAAQTSSPARKIKEHFEAKTAKFEYERLMGQWVEVAKIEAEGFKIARQIRDQLLVLPDRLCERLAHQDSGAIHSLLAKEIDAVLTNLSGIRGASSDGDGAKLANPPEELDANAT